MDMLRQRLLRLPLFLAALPLILFLSACATGPKIDWESRIGYYTFDQAVLEFGPPDKSAMLQDGTTVAEWLTSRGRRGGGGSFYSVGRYVHHVPDMPTPDYFIRLTFDPEGKLTAYRRVAK